MRRLACLAGLAAGPILAACGQSAPPPATVPAPAAAAVERGATAAGISEADLRLRLGIFAHDSMQGREAGAGQSQPLSMNSTTSWQRGSSGWASAAPTMRRTPSA